MNRLKISLLFCLYLGTAHAQVVPQNPNLFWASPSTGTGYLELRTIAPQDFNSGTGASGSTCLSGLMTWVACSAGTPSGPAGGALAGTYPNPSLAAGAAVANLGYTPANRAGDTFTGTLLAPTPAVNDNSTKVATTAWATNPLNIQGIRKYIYLDAVGVTCDNSTDNASLIQSVFSSLTNYSVVVFPSGKCLFKSALTLPSLTGIRFEGHSTELIYAGTSTTGNLITLGSASATNCQTVEFEASDIYVHATTVMTAGDGVLVNAGCYVHLNHFKAGDGDYSGDANLYNGIEFAGGNTIRLTDYDFRASHTAELVHGFSTSLQLTDIYQSGGGAISHSGTGLNICGNVGGFTIDQTDILLNNNNVVVDQSCIAQANSQIFFEAGVAVDANNSGYDSFVINDPGSNNSLLFFTGTWIATSAKSCLVINAGDQWLINYSGGTIFNCGSHGIYDQSTSTKLNIVGTTIKQNGTSGTGFGISAVANAPITWSGVIWGTNASGNRIPNIQPALSGGTFENNASDYGGVFQTTATSATLTFNTPWNQQPNCTVSPTASTYSAAATNSSTTTLSFTGLTNPGYYTFICQGDH